MTVPQLNISYKPQKISPKFQGTVMQLLQTKLKDGYLHPQFQTDVTKPLQLEGLLDQDVQTLSGGELQRVALILALGQPADIYLLDEPSAYLDSEQRIIAAKVIKRYIIHSKKTAFVVEHDFIMATYMADRVIVYQGQPGIDCIARTPTTLVNGMNTFLRDLNITFRRDPTNFRPRINKLNSQHDQLQKSKGAYFFLDDSLTAHTPLPSQLAQAQASSSSAASAAAAATAGSAAAAAAASTDAAADPASTTPAP